MRLTIKDADKSRGWSAKESMKVTRRTRFGKLLEKVRSLVRAASAQGSFDELDALLSRIETATKDRNHILHSLWANHRGERVIEDDEGIEDPPSLAELRRAADVLAKLVTDLNEVSACAAISRKSPADPSRSERANRRSPGSFTTSGGCLSGGP